MPEPDPDRTDNGQPYPDQGEPATPPYGYPAQPTGYQPQPTPVYVVPAAPPAPVTRPAPLAATAESEDRREEVEHPSVTIVSHSSLFYWWPVWVVGYIMAALTVSQGSTVPIGANEVTLHPSNNVGVLFFLTIFLVILITNIAVRGLGSLVVIMALVTTAVTMAYFRVWDDVLGWLGGLTVYLNQGAYFWFSTLLLITWLVTVFVFDRMNFWVIKPGQITYQKFWGMGSKSFDTENMTLEKHRDDLFRHWILGLGTGDLRIQTYGAKSQEIFIPNVLFVGSKVHAVQHLIAQEPSSFAHQPPPRT